MAPTGNLIKAVPIAAVPWIVQTIDPAVDAFLTGLPAPDFRTVADTKALWATQGTYTDEGSVVVGGGGGSADAFVVSAEVHRRIKAHRY